MDVVFYVFILFLLVDIFVSLWVIVLIKLDLKYESIVLNDINIRFCGWFCVMKVFVFCDSGLGGFGSMGLIILIWVFKGFGNFSVKLLVIKSKLLFLNILLRFENELLFIFDFYNWLNGGIKINLCIIYLRK